MKKDFEDFLEEMFLKESTNTEMMPHKDDFPDAFDAWVTDLPIDTVIIYANLYGTQCKLDAIAECRQILEIPKSKETDLERVKRCGQY